MVVDSDSFWRHTYSTSSAVCSRSLAEIVVFGRRAGEAAAARVRERHLITRDRAAIDAAGDDLDRWSRPSDELPLVVMHEVQNVMWEGCAVIRDGEGLERALEHLGSLAPAVDAVDGSPTAEGALSLVRSVMLRAALLSGRATVAAARARTESRGAHQRHDHPDLDPALRANLVVRLDGDGEFAIETRSIPDPPRELRELMRDESDTSGAHRLLE